MNYLDSARQSLSVFLLIGCGEYQKGLCSESAAVRRAALRAKARGVVAQARYLDGRPLSPN